MKYLDKLKDPRWQERRKLILGLDGFRCRDCHDTEITINIHHIYYLEGHEPWEYHDNALIALCEDCHALEHDRLKSVIGIEVTLVAQRLGLRAKHFEAAAFMLISGCGVEHAIKETGKRAKLVNDIQREQFQKYHHQELMMRERYGDEYDEYMAYR